VAHPREQALAELSIFPRVRGNLGQGIYRSTFFNGREHGLGRRATMCFTFEETAFWALELVRQYVPNFMPVVAF
jgi:hypothetical protein